MLAPPAMSVSSLGGPAPDAGLAASDAKRAFSGRTAWVFGADTGLGRTIAVELAGRGAEVWALGSDERALGEVIGEIAYQGGRGRHVVLPHDASPSGLLHALESAGAPPPSVLVALAADVSPAGPLDWFGGRLAALSPSLATGGAFLFAAVGSPPDELATWTRQQARTAARAERPFLLNVVVLSSADGDADGAARLAALACSPQAAGLSGQLVVVASA